MVSTLFFGSDKYSLIVLKALAKDKRFRIAGIITPPEAKVIQKFAQEKNLSLIYLTSIIYIIEEIQKLQPEIGILASFGKILPKEILAIPKHGILNIHPSLLPQYRGPTPVPTAILNGDKVTGVTIFKMDEKMDQGPIVAQFKEEIKPNETAQDLLKRLFAAGAEVLKTILPAYLEGRIELREQDHQKATYTKKFTRDDGFIPPEILDAAMKGEKPQSDKVSKFQSQTLPKNSATLPLCHFATLPDRLIRALHPWPGSWTWIKIPDKKLNHREHRKEQKKLKNSVTPEKFSDLSDKESHPAKKRLKILKAHLKNEKLILDQVQLEGKKPVSWKQFKEGYPKAKFVS